MEFVNPGSSPQKPLGKQKIYNKKNINNIIL